MFYLAERRDMWRLSHCFQEITLRKSMRLEQLYIYSLSANPQNGQTHSNNSSVVPNELFKCI